jgi:hypothetical protein
MLEIMEHVCIFFIKFILILDVIKRFITRGYRAEIYEALLKEKNKVIGIKMYISSEDDKEYIDRDISVGFNEKIKSEYTLEYQDKFCTGEFQCVTMELCETSLDKIVKPLISSKPKILLSDDV